MAKRLVDIDDALLERARSIAGTQTIKETVNAALQRLVDDEKVVRHVDAPPRLGGARPGEGRGSPAAAQRSLSRELPRRHLGARSMQTRSRHRAGGLRPSPASRWSGWRPPAPWTA